VDWIQLAQDRVQLQLKKLISWLEFKEGSLHACVCPCEYSKLLSNSSVQHGFAYTHRNKYEQLFGEHGKSEYMQSDPMD
jgi:hypothetical protein